MKKNLVKILWGLVCVALVLDMTGGALAQPERAGPEGDRFVGFHLVYERLPQPGEVIEQDRSHWTQYGSEKVWLDGVGSAELFRHVLIGQYDREEHRYVFPGLEGFNCFLVSVELDENTVHYAGYTDMADAKVSMGDTESSVSGTAYFGPPLDDSRWNTDNFDYGWTAYRVFQAADGAVYLDGTGNSYGGVGGFTSSTKEEYTATVNGEAVTETFEAEFSIQSVERLEEAAVKWFDGADQPLAERRLTPEEVGEGLSLPAPAGAAWALVTETDRTGDTDRTAYALDGEEGVSHRLVLLDDRGLGRVVGLALEPPGGE